MKKLLLFGAIALSINTFGQTNNNSIQFDGNSSYLDCGNPAELKIANEITYMAWVKTTQWTGGSGIVGRGEGTSGAPRAASFLMILSSTAGQIRWEISDGSLKDNLFSNTNLSLDTWNHIAVTWDGTNSATSMKIYIDGALDVSGASTISSINQNIAATEDDKFKIGLRDVIGAGQQYGHHNGFIDEVSAWSVALSELEIQQYMDCPPTGTELNLAGYWNFEDGTGSVAADLTANGNDANFVNSPLWSTDVVPYNCCSANPITAQPTDQSETIGSNATFSFTDALIGATYQWQMDAGTGYNNLSNAGQFSGTDTETLNVSSVTMGNNNTLYRCIVTESSNCQDTTDAATLTVLDNTGIDEIESLVSVHPNPTKDEVTLSVKADLVGTGFTITDNAGRVVLNDTFKSTEQKVNLSVFDNGVYFIRTDKESQPVKIIRQ